MERTDEGDDSGAKGPSSLDLEPKRLKDEVAEGERTPWTRSFKREINIESCEEDQEAFDLVEQVLKNASCENETNAISEGTRTRTQPEKIAVLRDVQPQPEIQKIQVLKDELQKRIVTLEQESLKRVERIKALEEESRKREEVIRAQEGKIRAQEDRMKFLSKKCVNARTELKEGEESRLCQICFERERDTVILSCMHYGYCNQCLVKHALNDSRCPICRQEMKAISKVWYC